ncbi:MAG: 5-oxoprolinase subunit PxpB [Bacillota bacterium]
MYAHPRLLPLGDAALTIEFGADIEPAAQSAVRACHRALRESGPAGVIEVIPTYRSVTVQFDPTVVSRRGVAAWLQGHDFSGAVAEEERPPVVIPVLYGGADGPDLGDVAAITGLPPDEVIRRHAAGVYTVSMIGFLAGFPYLGGLPPELAVPRLKTPRTRVPAGSVGLAGLQTGVYPTESPGGWQLIGRTSVRLWDPARERPSLLEPGDRVRFEPVAGEGGDR